MKNLEEDYISLREVTACVKPLIFQDIFVNETSKMVKYLHNTTTCSLDFVIRILKNEIVCSKLLTILLILYH